MYLVPEMIWLKFHKNRMLGSAKTKLPLPTLTSWVKVASPFYLRWYLTGNKWFIQFISVSLWLAAQRTQRSQSQGSRARKGKRNESWLPLSSPVITPIKSRWLRPQLAFFQCSMIGWSLGCYPLTASTYPGDDDDIYIMMKCLFVCNEKWSLPPGRLL